MYLKTIFSVSLIQFLISIINFLFGLSLAFYFGSSAVMDAYLGASTFIISLNVIFSKAQSKTFIPFISCFEDEKQNEIISVIFKINAIFFTISSLILFLFSNKISFLVAPGLQPYQHELMTVVFRIMAIYLIFSNINGIFEGLMHLKLKFKKVIVIRLCGTVILLCSFLSIKKFFNIHAIAISHVFSIFLICFCMSLYNWNKFTCKTKPLFYYKNEIKEYYSLILPILSASLFMWVIRISDSFIASFLKSGSISYLNYSQRIIKQPEILLMVIPTIFFPILSKLNKKEHNNDYLKTFYKGFELIISFSVPMAVFIAFYSSQIVRLLFERGKFHSTDTNTVAIVIKFYVLVLICAPLGTFLNNVYYSRKYTKMATLYTIISLLVNIILNFIFSYFYGIFGLAAASSISYVIGNVLQAGNIGKIIPEYNLLQILTIVFKITLSGACSLCFAFILQNQIPLVGVFSIDSLLLFALHFFIFFGSYFIFCVMFGVKSYGAVLKKLFKNYNYKCF